MDDFCLAHTEFYNITEKNFENIVKYISAKNITVDHKKILSIIYDVSNVQDGCSAPIKEYSLANTKIFLTMYLLKYVPDELVNISNEESKYIIDKSGKILGLFNMIIERYQGDNKINKDLSNTFKTNFSLFIVEFKKWQLSDISAFLRNAVIVTHDLRLTLNYVESKPKTSETEPDPESELMISVINKQLDDIHLHVISLNLDSRFIQEYNEYLIEQRISMLREEMTTIGKNAYYDLMEHRINCGEFGILETFLQDFKGELKKILPKNAEFNKNLNFDDSFDPDLLIQMIKHSAFDKEDFLKLFDYFYVLFMKLQPAEEDTELTKWKDEFMGNIESTDFIKSIIVFLRYYMDKIEIIQQKMIDFYNKIKEMESVD